MVPVIWLNFNPDAPNRGYWIQGLLDDLFSGKLWKIPGGFEYESHEGIPEGCDGAIVVVPGQQNAAYFDQVQEAINTLRWVIFITGDEENAFPVSQLQHPNMKIWSQSPGVNTRGDRFIGFGYPQGTANAMAGASSEKNLDWFFSGQITHPRREQCATALEDMKGGQFVRSPGFAQGLPQHEYWGALASAKVVPCPGGPVHQDSFRLYEALEAGCLPIVDNCAGYGEPFSDYWTKVFGENHPFISVYEWAGLSSIVKEQVKKWPSSANQVFAFWQKYKRKLAYDMARDVAELSGREFKPKGITVLVPTSPIPSNPSTHIIEETISSVRERLPDAEILIMVDGIRKEQDHKRADYAEFTRRLLWLCNNRWNNTLPIVYSEHLHQGVMTKRTMDLVTTPQVMFVEHDTPLIGEIDFEGVIKAIESGEVNLVRFHHEAQILAVHQYLMLDKQTCYVEDLPVRRTVQWSQRPHVASTEFYKWIMRTYFGDNSRTMIEDLMYGVLESHWREYGIDGWKKFKTFMYTPDGDIKRSTHTDGRAGESKYSMIFSYDGETPDLAPFPGEING